MRYTRMHEAAERVEMRRWLAMNGIKAVMGNEPSHTELLMKQVYKAGGCHATLMKKGRDKVDARRKREREAWNRFDNKIEESERKRYES